MRMLIILTIMFLISLPSPSQAIFLLPGRHSTPGPSIGHGESYLAAQGGGHQVASYGARDLLWIEM